MSGKLSQLNLIDKEKINITVDSDFQPCNATVQADSITIMHVL